MKKELQDAVIVAYGRSPNARAKKGSLCKVHPVEYAGQTLEGVLKKIPQLDPKEIEDVIVGCAKPEGVQSSNIGRLIAARAGLPYSVPGQTVNRFCSSGLQAISIAANMIMTGQSEVIVAGGVENMTQIPMGSVPETRCPWITEYKPGYYMPMGLTAENVANRYNVTREEMDIFAVRSHIKAYNAQQSGKFKDDIIPIEYIDDEGNKALCVSDEGIRSNSSLEKMASLPTAFLEGGTVTAGSASQMNDAASFVVMMSSKKAEEIGLKPIAQFIGFAVAGVDPSYMGIGPINAVPKVLKLTGLSINDIDVIELNEAFAAQSIPCIRELDMDPQKVNPNGGAIAMGHPMGATGAILTCKVLSELKRTSGKYGMVTMCVGGGMGAAAVYKMM